MTGGAYTVDYRLSDADGNVHSVWDKEIDPVLTVEPGEVVRFECRDAVDLKINEAVDAPNWVVSAYLPESIFPEKDRLA